MPALDFTAWPSKPAAQPAVSAGAPRQTGRAGASKTGSSKTANREFGQLVDRLADAPDEGKSSSPGVSARGPRDTGISSEESAAEPRAKKGDADGASGTASDAPAALASVASNPPVFPWTLPLNPSLWNIETVQVDGESASETGEGAGDSVIGAATAAIADGAAGACLATLPDNGTDAKASTVFEIRVDTPIAVNAAGTTIAAASAAPVSGSASVVEDGSAIDAIDTFAWTGAAAAAGAVSTDSGANVPETGAGGDLLANTNIVGAGLANAAVTGEPISSGVGVDSAIAQSAASALTNIHFEQTSTVDPNDSALLAQSAMDAATMATAVEGAPATGQAGQANAAIDGPLPGGQAREQALIELQRALESARGNAPSATAKHAANADAPVVIQTGASAGADASNDAAAAIAAASAAAVDPAAANAGDGSGVTIGPAGNETGVVASAIASASSSRLRDARQASEDSSADNDNTIAGASSWAAAAAAKYAEAAGAGTSDGSDLRDSGSNADAAASIAPAGRGETGTIAPIGFDARVLSASRADGAAASELPGGWAGESAIVTTAAPEDQAAQIVRSMRLQWRGATGEATLRLQPDHLGQVFVSVRVEHGVVSATVRAETPAAQQWIQQHQQQLRDALDAQGLRVAQFNVTSNPDDRPRRDREQDQNQNEDATGRRGRPRARNNDDDRRFEIHL